MEGTLLSAAKDLDRRGVFAQELLVVGQRQSAVLDLQRIPAGRKVGADLQQFFGAHGIKPDLVEEAQQPLPARGELLRLPEAIPHLQRSADELVATGTF